MLPVFFHTVKVTKKLHPPLNKNLVFFKIILLIRVKNHFFYFSGATAVTGKAQTTSVTGKAQTSVDFKQSPRFRLRRTGK